jgi:hypothetical protein
MPIPPFAPTPWLWLLGAGVALIVGVIAFLVASGLFDRQSPSSTWRRTSS